jgi:hypothetical protein
MTTLYRYSFDKRLVVFWGVFGVRPAKDGVSLTDDGRLRATFGLLKLETPLENVDGAHITRNYRWWTAAGARGSLKDDGLTFGTNANAVYGAKTHHMSSELGFQQLFVIME